MIAVQACLDQFYAAYRTVYGPTGGFYKSDHDVCRGNECAFHAMVVPTPDSVGFNARACLAAATPPPARRAAWIHIPKAGTAFVNTVSHWLDVDKSLPDYAQVPNCAPGAGNGSNPQDECSNLGFPFEWELEAFATMYPPHYWAGPHRLAADMSEGNDNTFCFALKQPGVVQFEYVVPNSTAAANSSTCMSRGHLDVSADLYKEWEGTFVALFREPASRSYSMYRNVIENNDVLHYQSLTDSCVALHGVGAVGMTPLEYVTTHAGLMTKMLSGQEDGGCGA